MCPYSPLHSLLFTIQNWCLVNACWMTRMNKCISGLAGQFAWEQQCGYFVWPENTLSFFWELQLNVSGSVPWHPLRILLKWNENSALGQLTLAHHLSTRWQYCFKNGKPAFPHPFLWIRLVFVRNKGSSLRKQVRYLVIAMLIKWVQKLSIIIRY